MALPKKPLIIAAIVVATVVAYSIFDIGEVLNFSALQQQQQNLQAWYQGNPVSSALLFFSIYIAVTALSLPGATIMTLASGAIFGLALGTLLASFASTIGATLAFLLSRYLFKGWVEQRFGARISTLNAGIQKDGGWYLLTLRLVPLFPFFLINLVMGVSKLPTRIFYWVSQLGMLPATLVYVNAGTQLASINTPADIASPSLIISLILLGTFPLIAKFINGWISARRVYQGWEKPKHYDRNLVVIGAGAGGLVSAYIASAVKASVTLVEKSEMGGDCLNTGCVPSKALIRAARWQQDLKRAEEFGAEVVQQPSDFKAVMARVHNAIEKIAPHDSVERYTELGVDVIKGQATLLDPWTVEINIDGKTSKLSSRNIIIATGARPRIPAIPGIDAAPVYTSDTLWKLSSLPAQLVVIGGGPIGCELAQAFSRLGSSVTILEAGPSILAREDDDAREVIIKSLKADGITIITEANAMGIATHDAVFNLTFEAQSKTQTLPFDALLCAAGRVGNSENLGLEALGLEVRDNGQLVSNDVLQTRFPNIYAVGDITGPYQFTHAASHQAWYAAVNALFSPIKTFKADYRLMPRATFTDPEVASVGINEQEAKANDTAYETTRYDLSGHDRAITEQEDHGYIKVLTVPGKDTILGASIVGYHASEMISHYVTAMKFGLGMNKLLGTIHLYPAMSEAIKLTAGQWKKDHAPTYIYPWLAKYHHWRKDR